MSPRWARLLDPIGVQGFLGAHWQRAGVMPRSLDPRAQDNLLKLLTFGQVAGVEASAQRLQRAREGIREGAGLPLPVVLRVPRMLVLMDGNHRVAAHLMERGDREAGSARRDSARPEDLSALVEERREDHGPAKE